MTPQDPFALALGMEIVEQNPETCTLRLTVTPQLLNGMGILHGGALATLVDEAMGLAIHQAAPGRRFVTADLHVRYLNPGMPGTVSAVARVVRLGRRLAVAEARVSQGEQLLAIATGTWASVE